jgi:hypothetical protein
MCSLTNLEILLACSVYTMLPTSKSAHAYENAHTPAPSLCLQKYVKKEYRWCFL